MVSNATTDTFTLDGQRLMCNGEEVLDLGQQHTPETIMRVANYAHAVGTQAGVDMTFARLSSQPKEAAATSGAQAAPHPCSLRPVPASVQAQRATAAYEASEQVADVLRDQAHAFGPSIDGYSSGTVRTGNERRNEEVSRG